MGNTGTGAADFWENQVIVKTVATMHCIFIRRDSIRNYIPPVFTNYKSNKLHFVCGPQKMAVYSSPTSVFLHECLKSGLRLLTYI